MTIGKGYEVLAGIDVATTWGTAVSVNAANKGIKILVENITTTPDYVADDSICGTRARQEAIVGRIDHTGNIDLYAQYANPNIFLLIAMAMGRAGAPSVVNPQPSGFRPYAYTGSIKMRDSLEGYFITLALDKQVAIHEWDSVKMNGMTISGEAGARVMLSMDTIARKWDNSSAVNTTLGSVSEPTPRKYVLFQDGTFRVKPQAGTALVGTNQIYPSAFSITVNNNMEPDLTSENDPYVDEPVASDFVEVTGSFTIPKYVTKSYENAFVAGTLMKADIRFITTTQIPAPGGGAYYYEFNLYLPQIQITEANAPVDGAGKIAQTIEFIATKAATAPDGMDGNGGDVDTGEARGSITNPIEIEFKTSVGTDPLA